MRLPPTAFATALVCASALLAAACASKPWHPGAFHPVAPHVVAGAEYGTWMPEPGYAWADPDDTSENAAVRWVPGLGHPLHPHVVAGPQPGKWMPAEGFAWTADSDANMWKVKPVR